MGLNQAGDAGTTVSRLEEPDAALPAVMLSAAFTAMATLVSVGLLADPRGINPFPPR
jgi:hypothetical protein